MSTNIQVLPGKVGISNANPIHTLDVGSNVYVDDTATNKLTVIGKIQTTDINVTGNMVVAGTTTVVNTENLSIKDPIIELARDSVGSGDTGVLMKRATNESNVAVFYDESADVLKMGYTLGGANDTTIELDSNALAVSIQGALTVGGNVSVSGTLSQTDVPAFRVQLTDGSISGARDIDYNSVIYDNTSSYSTSTGRFTAPVSGRYFFTAHGIANNTRTQYDFTINGTRQNINSLSDSPSSGFAQCNISAMLNLTAGQYVTVYQAEGSTYGESTASSHNTFSGFFIG